MLINESLTYQAAEHILEGVECRGSISIANLGKSSWPIKAVVLTELSPTPSTQATESVILQLHSRKHSIPDQAVVS